MVDLLTQPYPLLSVQLHIVRPKAQKQYLMLVTKSLATLKLILMLPSSYMQVAQFLHSTPMHLTFMNKVEKSEPLNPHQEIPTIVLQRCYHDYLWNHQTCHVLCTQSINGRDLLWLQKCHPPLNHPWIIGPRPRCSNTSHLRQFHFPWPYPPHHGIQSVQVKLHVF